MKVKKHLNKSGIQPLSKLGLFVTLMTSIFIFGIIGSTLIEAQSNSEITYSPFSDITCEDDVCTAILYSYEKYFYTDNNIWVDIDENWFDCSGGGITKFCTNEYHIKIEGNEDGSVSTFLDNNDFTMQLSNFLDSPLSFNPTIDGSVLTYENVIPNFVDVRYQYLPRQLKEEIVIKQPLPDLPGSDFAISFITSGNAEFDIPGSIICDSNGTCQDIDHTIDGNQVTLTIPVSFLNDPNMAYPIIIDPTLEINYTDIIWDGYVSKDSAGNYNRTNSPKLPPMKVSKASTLERRGSTHWDISVVPANVSIYNLTLSLDFKSISCGACISPLKFWIKHMEGDDTTYTNNNTGNLHFYTDMGNGTLYNETILTHGSSGRIGHIIGSQGLGDFIAVLNSDDKNFSFGYSVNQNGISTEIFAYNAVIASKRPKLIVVYDLTTSDSNDAIEQGINNSLVGPDNPIQSDQQIYLVNTFGLHYTGTFDRSTIKNNQTWALNYVTVDEPVFVMPSLFNSVNVWQNDSLTFDEIVNQVETFINDTIL